MYFIIEVLSRQHQERNFSFQLDEQNLELGLDTLTALVSKGDQLLEVCLVFDDSRTNLPVSIFDGQGFSQPIALLKNQWEEILSALPEQPMNYINTNELLKKAQVSRQLTVDNLLMSRQQMQALLVRASQKPCNDNLLNHYQSLVDRYDRLLANIRPR